MQSLKIKNDTEILISMIIVLLNLSIQAEGSANQIMEFLVNRGKYDV